MQLCLCLKLQVQLPQKKLKKTIKMLCKDLPETVERFAEEFNREGVDFLYSAYFTTCHRFLDLPRKQELYALINRMRRLRYEVKDVQQVGAALYSGG